MKPWERDYGETATADAPKPWERDYSGAEPSADFKKAVKKAGKDEKPAKPKVEDAPPGFMDRVASNIPFLRGPIEASMAMGSGALAKPFSDIAGFGFAGREALTGEGRDPEAMRQNLRQSMTYSPRSEEGRNWTEYNPLALLAKAVSKGGEFVRRGIEPPPDAAGPLAEVRRGAARGAEEAVNQAPGVLGGGAGRLGEAVGGGMKTQARSLMQSALKPDARAMRTGKAAKAVDTMLDEGVNVTPGGVEKLRARRDALNDEIDKVIAGSPAIIKKNVVGKKMRKLMDEVTEQVDPSGDLAAIQKTWQNFMDHPLLTGSRTMSVQTAQKLKRGTYKQLGDKQYGELKGAEVTAQKVLASELREAIAKAVPKVAPLNAEESRMINALNLTEKRVMMSANKNPMGLGAFAILRPKEFVAWMADRSELFKSLIARMFNAGSQAAPPGFRAAGAAMVPGSQIERPPGENPPD